MSGMSSPRRELTYVSSLPHSQSDEVSAEENFGSCQYGRKDLNGNTIIDMANEHRTKDKSDTCTKDELLDSKTEKLISRMINRMDIESVGDCIAAGNDSSVYHCKSECTTFSGVPGNEIDCVLKVHKTLRNFASNHGYSNNIATSDLRDKFMKVVISNLRKMALAGIPCPKVYSRFEHLLLMEFVGDCGVAAPRLHDSPLNLDLACTVYRKIVKYMRTMYWKCNMVHGDLSEFNILLFKNTPYIIGVSHAVPRGNPNSFKLLRQDCTNITEFFRKIGVSTMMAKELFSLIVDSSISDENIEKHLDDLNKAEYLETDDEMIKPFIESAAVEVSSTNLNSQMSICDDMQFLINSKNLRHPERKQGETTEEKKLRKSEVKKLNAANRKARKMNRN